MNTKKVNDAIKHGKEILDRAETTVVCGNIAISEWDIEVLEAIIFAMKDHNEKFEAGEFPKGIVGIPSVRG